MKLVKPAVEFNSARKYEKKLNKTDKEISGNRNASQVYNIEKQK